MTAFALNKVVHLTWKDCSSSDAKAKINSLTVTPSTPSTGQAFSIVTDFAQNEAVTGGSIDYKVKKGFLTLLSGTEDVCKSSTVSFPMGAGSIAFNGLTCPQATGDVKFTSTGNIADIPITGSVDINITVKDQTGAQLSCVDINADIENSVEEMFYDALDYAFGTEDN